MKKFLSVLLVISMLASLCGVIPITAAEDVPALGAEAACAGHTLGVFGGVPACVDENDGLHICENNFPDREFRRHILMSFAGAEDMYLTEEECRDVKYIKLRYFEVSDLSGIEFFTQLEYLNCRETKLTALDLRNNTALIELDCCYSELTELDVSTCRDLVSFLCFNNQIEKLDVRDCVALKELSCGYNSLSHLDLRNNTKLTNLFCSYNVLMDLDLQNNIALERLGCSNNSLSELDVSNNPFLRELSCQNNYLLTRLDLQNNTEIGILTCDNNRIRALNLGDNTTLRRLSCSSNALTELDLRSCVEMDALFCSDNLLTELDLRNNVALQVLNCSDNRLAKLDLQANKHLNADSVKTNPQQRCVDAAYRNEKWEVDLGDLLSSAELKRIVRVSEGVFDPYAGTVTFEHLPTEFMYSFSTGYRDFDLEVTVTLVPERNTYTAQINGVEYEYACGEDVSLVAASFFTEKSWAYRFVGWQGDTDCVADTGAAVTVFKMPEQNIVLNAVYILVGDLDEDGLLDASDALLMARMIAGRLPEASAGDIDGDGMLSAADLVYMRKYLAGSYIPEK